MESYRKLERYNLRMRYIENGMLEAVMILIPIDISSIWKSLLCIYIFVYRQTVSELNANYNS